MYILTNTLLMFSSCLTGCHYTSEVLNNVNSDFIQYFSLLTKHLRPHCKLCEGRLTYQASQQEYVLLRWLLWQKQMCH